MRLSILLPDLRGGGVERIRIVLAREFARMGHDVEFVLMQARGELIEEARNSFEIVDLECDRLRQVPAALARYLRASRPDALLAAMWPLTGMASLAHFMGSSTTSLIVSEHVDFRVTPSFKPSERWLLSRFGQLLYSRAAGVVAVSRGVAQSLSKVAGVPPENVTVIHNPVRTMEPDKLNVDREGLSSWMSAPRRLIAVGSLKHQKGFDTLLHALARLRQTTDARLLILGEGGLRPDLEALCCRLCLEDAVTMPGFRQNTATYLQHAHLFVLSSDWEGFGNVVVEALAMAVPVVSTDCRSGPAEILEGGRFGRLVPPRDPAAMARAIGDALASPLQAEHLQERARAFTPERAAAQYLGLLRENTS